MSTDGSEKTRTCITIKRGNCLTYQSQAHNNNPSVVVQTPPNNSPVTVSRDFLYRLGWPTVMAGMSIPPVFTDMYVQNVKCIVSLRKKYNDITTHIVYSFYRVLVSANECIIKTYGNINS